MLLIGLGLAGLVLAVGAWFCAAHGRRAMTALICAAPVVGAVTCWTIGLLMPVVDGPTQVEAQLILVLAIATSAIGFITLLGAVFGMLHIIGKIPASSKQITPGGTL